MEKKQINHWCRIIMIMFFYTLGLLIALLMHTEGNYPKKITDLVMEVGGFFSIVVTVFYLNDLMFNWFGLDILGKIKRIFLKMFKFAKDA